MKYRIKNKKIEELVYSLFDEEAVQKSIAKQITNDMEQIWFRSPEETKVNQDNKFLNYHKCSLIITVHKSYIEEVREYTLNGWNSYPHILPPIPKMYLVQMISPYDDSYYLDILSWTNKKTWDDEGVIAFRELPELYNPEE